MKTNKKSNSKLKDYDSIEAYLEEKKEIEKKINSLVEDFMTKYSDAVGYSLIETFEGKFERCLFKKNELPLILNLPANATRFKDHPLYLVFNNIGG